MTLFQISRGIEANLPEAITDGKMYYCTDTSNLYIDYQESRFQINANFSNGLHYVKEETEIELDAETLVSAINSKSTIYFGDTQPENLIEQDLWIQFLSDNKSQLSYIDTNGIIHNIFPVTKKENIGIYVTQTEPVQVTDGDIWIDTSGTPADSGDTPVQTGVEVISNSNAANLYVWRRNEGLENTYLLTASAAMRLHSWDIFPGIGSEPQIKGYYADSISVVDNAIFLNDATEVVLSGAESYNVTKGKYLSIHSNVYKIAENATFTLRSQFAAVVLVGYYIECSDCQMCFPAGGYVSSNLRTAYPDNGQGSDGNNYKYLGQLGQQLNNQIPFFDLVTLGLPAITIDGNEVSLECDTSKIRAALAINNIKIRYQISNGSSTFTCTTIANPSYEEEGDVYQLLFMGISRIDNHLYAGLLHFDIFTTGIKAFFYPSEY